LTCNNPNCPMCHPEHDREDHDNASLPCPPIQTHTHEFAGSVQIAGPIPHNHRFAGVSSEAIPYGKSHVHAILVNTDFFFNHYHELGVRTGPAIPIKENKHIHYVEGKTTLNFNHVHDFAFTTFIENPLQD
jgi:hypothetical protein